MLKVLVACEESQTVTKAFLYHGHDAYSCDIIPCSGGIPERHIQTDVLNLLDPSFHWDLIIAHPPCTYLSNVSAPHILDSNGHIKDLDRYQKMIQAREFFYKFYNVDFCPIAIENPRPLKIANLPKYTDIITANDFGDPWHKYICLWLKGLPPLMSTVYQVKAPSYHLYHNNQVIRSKFFPGVADAMAQQWGEYLDD